MNKTPQFSHLPPLSLYIHFPWCLSKCPYCDFNSHAVERSDLASQSYIQALIEDLCFRLPDIWQRRCYTIFMGGGTPSLFSPEEINQLLSQIRSLLPVDPMAEITMEANPGSLECGSLAGYRDAGITRLSLGVQSFQTEQLTALGRIHGAEEAYRHAENMIALFPSCNIDMMYALPGQNSAILDQDLTILSALHPPHVSYYHLTIEPHTAFFAHPPALPSHDDSADMMAIINHHLEQEGYQHYEISAYAQSKHQCRHNLNYWQYGDFLGIGAGAASKITLPDGRILRTMNAKHPKHFLDNVHRSSVFIEQKTLSTEDIIVEFALNAFRLSDGFSVRQWTERTGLSFLHIVPALEEAEKHKWITRTADHIQPTPLGLHFLNDLVMLFLPDRPRKKKLIPLTKQ